MPELKTTLPHPASAAEDAGAEPHRAGGCPWLLTRATVGCPQLQGSDGNRAGRGCRIACRILRT